MAESVEIIYKFVNQGQADAEKLTKTIADLSAKIGTSSADLLVFESNLKSSAKAGYTLEQALASLTVNGTPAMQELAMAIRLVSGESAKAEADAAKLASILANKVAPGADAAQVAIQGLGRNGAKSIAEILAMTESLSIGVLAIGASIGIGVAAFGDLLNSINPVLAAEQASLKILQDSGREYEKLASQAQNFKDQEIARIYGTSALLKIERDRARIETEILDAAAIGRLEAQISEVEKRIRAGSLPRRGSGTTIEQTQDAQAATQQRVGLLELLDTARKQQEVDARNANAFNDRLQKDSLDRARDTAAKIDQINKQTIAISEKAIALSDSALYGNSALGRIQAQIAASDRTADRQLGDVNAQSRLNQQGGPDTVRVPESVFDKQRVAIQEARVSERASLLTSFAAEVQKIADRAGKDLQRISDDANKADVLEFNQRGDAFLAKLKADIDTSAASSKKLSQILDVYDRLEEVGPQQRFQKQQSRSNLLIPVGSTQSAGDAANDAYASRLEYARQINVTEQARIDLMKPGLDRDLAVAQARLKLVQETGRADLDYQDKLAAISRQNLQDARNNSGRVFDALTGGSNGIQGLFKNFGLSQGRNIFENLTEDIFKSSTGGLHGLVSAKSSFASLLKGTILEPPQGKEDNIPVNANTTALNLNREALEHVTSVLLAGTGGGGGSAVQTVDSALKFASSFNLTPGSDGFSIPTTGSSESGGGIPTFLTGTGVTQGSSSPPPPQLGKTSSNLAKALGYGGAIAGGAYGIYSGIQEGGVRGATTSLASAVGVAAAIDPEPVSKAILAGASIIIGLVKSFLPDPRRTFENAQNAAIDAHRYQAPTPIDQSYDFASGGSANGYDYRGRSRVTVVHNYNVQAWDAASFSEGSKLQSSKVIGDQMRSGNPDLALGVNQIAFGI